MSVAWSTINPVLISLLTDIAVDQVQTLDPPDIAREPLWSAEWDGRKKTFVHPKIKQSLFLEVTSCVGVGEDETRYEFDDDPDVNALAVTQTGNRRFVLQVRSEVFENTDSLWCMETLERIRTRLYRPSSIEALLDVEVALIRIEKSVKVPAQQDQRALSAGVMDIVFAAAVNDVDPVPVGWIERIQLTSDFKDGAESLESPPNVTDDWIPDAPP